MSHETPTTSLGIDLAAQNANTAVCIIEWHPGHAVAWAPHVEPKPRGNDDDWLIKLTGEAKWVGIDAPFGWPDAMVHALPAWAETGRWTTAEKADLTYRLTDRRIGEMPRQRLPLSVSSDRIAITAWRCAGLLDRMGTEAGGSLSRVGTDGVYEVYPGGALTAWEFDRVGYKARGGAEAKTKQRCARVALLKALRERAPWLVVDAIEEACHVADHALDALIAALVARAAGVGLTRRPDRNDDHARIEREGWIHLPAGRETYEQLLSPPGR